MIISICNRNELHEVFKKARNEKLCFSKTKNKSIFVKCVLDNKIVGFGEILFLSSNRARLRNNYTIPDYRNLGVGRKILEYSLSLLKDYQKIDVYTYNYHFFLKYHFELKRNYYLKDGTPVYHMEKHQ